MQNLEDVHEDAGASEVPAPRRVLGVLAGGDLALETLAAWARSADLVIAADGGLSRLLDAGVDADVVIGDLDSVRPEDLGRTKGQIFRILDQETTDCDKLLAFVHGHGHEAVTLVGIEGDRFDHTLAAIYAAMGLGGEGDVAISFGLRGMWARIVLGGESVAIDASAGATVSLLPLGSAAIGVTLDNVAWPVRPEDGEAGEFYSPTGRYSISNRALGPEVGPVRASLEGGRALLLVGTDGEAFWPEFGDARGADGIESALG